MTVGKLKGEEDLGWQDIIICTMMKKSLDLERTDKGEQERMMKEFGGIPFWPYYCIPSRVALASVPES